MTSSGWSPLQWEFPRRIDPKQTWCVRKCLSQGWIKAWFKHIYGNVYGPVNPLHRKQYFVLLIRMFQTARCCCEVLWWVCLSVCLSIRENISGSTCAIFTNFLCIRGSVLLWHVDDRPHRLSAGRGDESAHRGRSVIYNCLVNLEFRRTKLSPENRRRKNCPETNLRTSPIARSRCFDV